MFKPIKWVLKEDLGGAWMAAGGGTAIFFDFDWEQSINVDVPGIPTDEVRAIIFGTSEAKEAIEDVYEARHGCDTEHTRIDLFVHICRWLANKYHVAPDFLLRAADIGVAYPESCG